jgi:hypothetical protein
MPRKPLAKSGSLPILFPDPADLVGGWEYRALSGAAEDRLVVGAASGPAQDARREATAIPAKKRNNFIRERLNRSSASHANKIDWRHPCSHSERSGAESRNPVPRLADNATGSLDFARDDGTSVTLRLALGRSQAESLRYLLRK